MTDGKCSASAMKLKEVPKTVWVVDVVIWYECGWEEFHVYSNEAAARRKAESLREEYDDEEIYAVRFWSAPVLDE